MIRMRTDFFAESLGMGTSMVVLMPQAAAGIGMGGADAAAGAGAPEGGPGVPVLYLLHGLSDDCTIWERRTSIE
ncbi:MAG: esterase family protein, partial [Actinomycetales bacterium]|nr:esterase family protein [Actinomycetales bacterium]